MFCLRIITYVLAVIGFGSAFIVVFQVLVEPSKLRSARWGVEVPKVNELSGDSRNPPPSDPVVPPPVVPSDTFSAVQSGADFERRCMNPNGKVLRLDERRDGAITECTPERRIRFIEDFDQFVFSIACAGNHALIKFGTRPWQWLTNAHVILQEGVPQNGMALEFGVWRGNSIRTWGKKLLDNKWTGPVAGFDSFKGLPEDWNVFKADDFAKLTPSEMKKGLGNMYTIARRNVDKRIELVAGWFNESLPPYLEKHKEELSFLHVDCDLYVSTNILFNLLDERMRVGTIILFDELFGYETYRDHEIKALYELMKRRPGIELCALATQSRLSHADLFLNGTWYSGQEFGVVITRM